jgi:hypothetical protein
MKMFPLKIYYKISVLLSLNILLVLPACKRFSGEREIIKLNTIQENGPIFSGFLGINGFEWDFLDKTGSKPDPEKVNVMKSFGAFRHYMDWERIESEKGKYYFNPTHSGGFNYDTVYEVCATNNIEILTCFKSCPSWIMSTYPKDERDNENVPANYGLDRSNPATYIDQAKAGFQFAARYGSNKNINTTLIYFDRMPDKKGNNQPIIGLNYVRYIECNNEVDKTWKGNKAYQSAQEYAANLSAFYDGDLGKLGKNAGVKNADPSMQVVMSGLGLSGPEYVIEMINWCKQHRGVKADGSVNLCFDVINYHFYNNDASPDHDNATTGVAPELSLAGKIADGFVSTSKKYANNIGVWITESGYDINAGSQQHAPKIKDKSAEITQADWMLRSSFLYARHGLKSSFFYMLEDAAPNKPGRFATSGFVSENKKRPAADYFLQTKKLLGLYSYEQTIARDPIVDVYNMKNKKIYVLYVPDQVDRRTIFELSLPGATLAKVYHLQPGADDLRTETIALKNEKLKLELTETPIFVEKTINISSTYK